MFVSFKLKVMASLHEKTATLVEKLHKGFVLFKIHYGDDTCKEFLISDDIGHYEMKGWGTAFGNVNDRLAELISHPELWNVMDFNHKTQDPPYPWSYKYNE